MKTQISNPFEQHPFEYQVNWLRTKIESKDWNAVSFCQNSSRTYILKWDLKGQEQIEAYLAESLLTGLLTNDRILMFRCFSQAAEYVGRMKGCGWATYPYSDFLTVLKNRIEESLK